MQLTGKPKTFGQFFIPFVESKLNFEILKKNEPHSSSISEVIDPKRCAYLKL